MKIVRQHRKLAKNAPIGGPQLARIRDFQVFRDLGAHEADLGPPTTCSITHRQRWDPDHSTDQDLASDRIARKSNSSLVRLRWVGQLARRPPRITLKHPWGIAGRCSTSHLGQLGRRRVSIWGSETASRHQEIEFLKKIEDFSIFAPTACLGVVNSDFGAPTDFATEQGLIRD